MIDPHYGSTHEPFEFEWNNQKALVQCDCGHMLEVFSDQPEVCKCGRTYWLTTEVRVEESFNPLENELLRELIEDGEGGDANE